MEKPELLYSVFGNVHSDCGNPVQDLLGKYHALQEAEEIKEIFDEAYDEIVIEPSAN